MACQRLFPVELPAAEMRIAQPIQAPEKAGRVENMMQFFASTQPLDVGPTQHLGGGVAVVRAVPKSPVDLVVVIIDNAG